MNTNIINIRIDEQTKKESKKVFESMGLTLSGGIKLILKNLVKTKKIPELTENGFSKEYEEKLLNSVKEIKEKEKTFFSVDEMINSILK